MSGADTMTVVDSVKVRMYKKLLGDCLLLIVKGHAPGPDGTGTVDKSSHILIDCGVLQGTPDADTLMNNAVSSIYAETGQKPLDLVIVTHEHHDHISGFSMARESFEKDPADTPRPKIINKLWMAWTEDPDDDDAREYQARYGQAFAALSKLADHLKVPTKAAGDSEEFLGLAGFSGPLALQGDNGKQLRGSRAIYANLRSWAGEGNTSYLSPGQVLDTPGDIGLKAYVLGPPRDEALLLKSLPSSKNPETYFGMGTGVDESASGKGVSPFSPIYRWRTTKDIRAAEPPADGTPESDEWLLRSRYFGKYAPCRGNKHIAKEGAACRGDFALHEPQEHRRLDNVAQAAFSNLALRMDSNTNNTSLVLAFELPGDAGVMLFAADAQVGNWLSWDNVAFRTAPGEPPLAVTSKDLLARTRLYKVGHHGSHNATLKEKGLERMSGDLVAMIPTDAAFALKQTGRWQMPNPRVEAALNARTGNRVLRGDRKASDAISAYRKKAGSTTADDFARRVNDQGDYVEYTVYQRQEPA